MRKRMLSVLLCLVMVMSLLPTAVFAVEEGENGEGTTIAVPDNKAYVLSTKTEYDSLDEAMENATNVDTIYLGAGTYCGNTANPTNKGNGAGKSLTFVGAGTGKTTWQIRAPETTYEADGYCDYSFDGSDSITFEKMTVVGSVYPDKTTKANDTQGLVRINNITLKDCTFNGRADYWGYEATTFDGVTFNAPGTEASGIDGTNYSLWTYTGNTYNFQNCIFNSTGKTINVYRHTDPGYDVTVNFENCTVKNTAHKKQAMKINDSKMGNSKFIIKISGNNNVEGIEPSSVTCSRLFGFDADSPSENSGRTTVKFGDTVVWQDGKMVDAKAYHNGGVTVNDVSYNNGNDKANASLYTDGYKDNAFTEPASWSAGADGYLHRTGKRVCDYCGYSEDINETKPFDLDVSRSKTATELDSSNQSEVTLSLPSAQEKLSSDVVFVLDTSDCVGSVMNQVSNLVGQLKTAQEKNGANIKVGVVAFKGSALPMFDGKLVSVEEATQTLTEMINKVNTKETKDEKEAVVLQYLNTNEDFIYKGSNLHSGLQAAQTMLDSDDTVAAGRKYVVTVTDGLTYYWNDDAGNVYSVYSKNSVDSHNLLFYAWCETNNVDSSNGYALPDGFDWTKYVTDARAKIAADGNKYRVNVREAATKLGMNYSGVRFPEKTEEDLTKLGIPAVPATENSQHALGMDYSVISCLDTYEEMVDAGYQCYTLNPNTKYGTDTFSGLFTFELNEMANKTVVDFNSIQNDILYAVGAGSTVTDTIGDNFTLVGTGDSALKDDSFTLTVKGIKIEGVVAGNTVNFGTKKDDGSYPYTVTYTPTTKTFVWTINENVSNFAPVQLTYTVKLTNPKTSAGTYGQTDLNGDGKVDETDNDVNESYALYTNESATLTPKDSEGNLGKTLPFPKPSVSYTVKSSGGGGGSTTYYYFSLEKIDAQDSHTLNGAKFGLYLDGKQIATATSNSSGIATFRVDASNYRKIDTTSNLYYQELTAPEGYVLSSDKINLAKSDLTTSQTTAEKKAETVRNYRTSTPDQLNDEDHFAYAIGYEDGTVRPNSQISRAETATIFFRLLKDSVRDGNLLTSNAYADVLNSYWANTAISTMTGLGIVQGRSSTTFDPQAPITRAEFAAICARFDTGTSSGSQTFSDISGHWAEKYIQRAAELGWIKGFEDGSFRPDTYITRAQAMTMVNRVLNRIPEETSDLLSNMNVWPDCNPSDWFYLAVQEATNSHDFKHKAGNYETWTGMKADPDWTRYEK